MDLVLFQIFCFELIYFCGINEKKTVVSIIIKILKNFLWDLEQLIEYSTSAYIVVSSNPSFGPFPRTKISFFLLPIWTDNLLATPKITTFLPQLKFGAEKSERESNPILYPE